MPAIILDFPTTMSTSRDWNSEVVEDRRFTFCVVQQGVVGWIETVSSPIGGDLIQDSAKADCQLASSGAP